VVNDILDITLIEFGEIKLRKETVYINDLLKDIFLVFEPETKKKGLKFVLETCSFDDECVIPGSRTRLSQVIYNLINNAIKFTSEGEIVFGCERQDGEILFYVRDTGIGIPENLHIHIFKRFWQADINLTRQYGGTGLGLSISKALVEKMDGKIWVESKVGLGSKFLFTIPYEIANSEKHIDDKAKESASATKNPTTTILVAEDEHTNFFYINEILSSSNIAIIHAKNGQEAIDLCRKHKEIDLILMDIRMPIMDGLTAVKKIRTFMPEIPIIAQTAYAMPDDREKALAEGCNDFISKPYKKENLLQIIQKHISQR